MIRKRIEDFDRITRFRLTNGFIFAIGINLITPTLIDIKGEYLTAWVISLFLIGEQLIVRTNPYLVKKFSMKLLFRFGIFIHMGLICSAALFFINPILMIISEGLIYIISVAVFSAYTIKLTNYLVDNYPDSISSFQIVRNRIWADGLLIGLCAAVCVTYFYSNHMAIFLFIIWEIAYITYMLKNWNFYSNLALPHKENK